MTNSSYTYTLRLREINACVNVLYEVIDTNQESFKAVSDHMFNVSFIAALLFSSVLLYQLPRKASGIFTVQSKLCLSASC